MPNCPNCGTWNPDDKKVCWRCQTELPKPQPPKRRKQTIIWGLPVWAWVVLALMTVLWLAVQCGALQMAPS
ncbi:MAG: hypothetical protein Kow0047_31340 [Anaerolineae bacterium]